MNHLSREQVGALTIAFVLFIGPGVLAVWLAQVAWMVTAARWVISCLGGG